MKTLITCLAVSLFTTLTWSQDKEAADALVAKGVELHEKADYQGAIKKYDEALALDEFNLFALAEKAYTQLTLGEAEPCVENCKLVIAKHPGEEDLKTVYVTYGNAMDMLKEAEAALRVYDEGIAIFPDFYQLYFNKGITLVGLKNYAEAKESFKRSLTYNPEHASSHNALARLSHMDKKNIPALLAYARFLAIEPEGERAALNLENLKMLLTGNAEKTGKNSITINISPEMMADTLADGSPGPDNFMITEMILSMSSATDFDKKNKKKTEQERFQEKFDLICSSLSEGQAEHTGFFWEYYVPYFVEMKEKELIETFSYIVYASSEDKKVTAWIKENPIAIKAFYTWSNNFTWSDKLK